MVTEGWCERSAPCPAPLPHKVRGKIPLSRVFLLCCHLRHFRGKLCCDTCILLKPIWVFFPIFHRKIGLFFKENKANFQANMG